MRGGAEAGLAGGLRGVGLGLAGLVFKPVGGAVDMVQSSFAGLETLASGGAGGDSAKGRARDPRHFGPTGVVAPYSRHRAMGVRFVAETFGGQFASHLYLSHLSEQVEPAKVRLTVVLFRAILVVTAKGKGELRAHKVVQTVPSARLEGLRATRKGVELWFVDGGTELLEASVRNVPKVGGAVGWRSGGVRGWVYVGCGSGCMLC
jgi:hypothetical protein